MKVDELEVKEATRACDVEPTYRGGGARQRCPAAAAPPPANARAVAKRVVRRVKYLLPDPVFLLLSHRRRVGRWPNLVRPRAFNELILRRCMRPEMRWVDLTDKLAVREYVKRKVGEAHLIPLIAAPETFTQAVFDALPDAFVMKANHGCAFVELVREKSRTTYEALAERSRQWLAVDFYRESREQHYRYIKPRLFFEQLLADATGKVPADLKLHVFGARSGTPVIYAMVISDRFGDVHGDMFDADWNRLDIEFGPYHRSDKAIERPANWPEVLDIATRLAADFDYVRVDLYSTGDAVYFGELTFTPGAGVLPFRPDWVDFAWGELLSRVDSEGG
jgi:hypothetical protein